MKLIQLAAVMMTLVAASSHTAMADMSVVVKSCTKTVVVQGTFYSLFRMSLYDVARALETKISSDQSSASPSFSFLNDHLTFLTILLLFFFCFFFCLSQKKMV